MTSHSEYSKLTKVAIKRPEAAFISQANMDIQWKSLNFLERPDYENSIKEYNEFEALLRTHGAELHYLPQSDKVSMDSIYCRDATIITDHGVILCDMGKSARKPEPAVSATVFKDLGYSILGEIKDGGTIEGGDVAWLDTQTLAVAHGYRTNDKGYQQIKAMLAPFGIDVIQVDLPHYKGPSDVFHLMSIFSPIDKDKAVVYSPLMPVRFRELLLRRGYELIEVPESEFESMGCNVLAIAPSRCIMVAGNPITKERIEQAGCTVHDYIGHDISVKGGGGPTCLTRPLLRA